MSDGRKKYLFPHLSPAKYSQIVLFFFLQRKFMTRQNIILWYENIVTKVNELSYDTFLKTIGAEMNGPGPS